MGCCMCYCCLDEDAKVAIVLRKFPAAPVSQALNDGMIMKAVGRVVIAGNNAFNAPLDNKPCVFWRVHVEEERMHTETYYEQSGERQIQRTREVSRWDTLLQEEQMCDFWLQDGVSKLFINGSNKGCVKRQSRNDANSFEFVIPFNQIFGNAGAMLNMLFGGATGLPPPSPGIWFLINKHKGWGWHGSHRSTGRFRCSQASFDVNELVTALGIIAPFMDPVTGQACKQLVPLKADKLTDEYCKANNWEDWDRRAWEDMVTKSPNVLVSDDPEFSSGVMVQQVVNLPPYMLYVPFQPMTPQMMAVQPQGQMFQATPYGQQPQQFVMQQQPMMMQPGQPMMMQPGQPMMMPQ